MRRSALAFALLLAGCRGLLAGPEAPPRPPPRQCATDADCNQKRHEVCRVADGSGTPPGGASTTGRFDGICVIPAQASTSRVFLEVRPTSDDVPPTQYGPVALGDGQNQAIVLPAPASVTGAVVEHLTGRAIGGAKVRFKLEPLITDRPLSFDVTTSGADPAAGAFSRVVPEGRYAVTVVPPPSSGAVKPPPEHPFEGDESSDELAGAAQTFDLSSPAELVTFAGTATISQDGEVVPAANVEVWAIDAASVPAGLTGSGALAGHPLAQPVTTDENGRFTLWLPRLSLDASGHSIPHEVRLQFGPPSGASYPAFVDPTTYTVDADGASPSNPPPAAKIDSPVDVKGRVQVLRGGELVGLAQARVTFRTVDDAPFSFSTTVVTGDDGSYDVSLYPAVYQPLAALPPTDGESEGVPVGDCPPDRDPDKGFQISPGQPTTRDFLCEPAAPLAGETRAHDAGVPFVSVEAVRHKDEAIADDLHLRTTSDQSGVFAIYVPPGDYDLVLTPPATSKLPVTIVPVGEVSSDAAQARLVIELDPPFELFGQLFSGDRQHPLAASIDAYRLDDDGTSHLVGQTASGNDGAYSLILPASGK